MIKFLLLIALFGVTSSAPTVDEFSKQELVPDIVDAPPEAVAEIKWPSGAMAQMGNKVTPTEAEGPPEISWEADPNKFYLIIFTDPDAPSRKDPNAREWHHWIVGNIPGKDVSKGEVLSEYIPSAPGKDTEAHRYTYLIWEQPNQVTFDWKKLPPMADGRAGFKTRDFVKKHGIEKLVAGNFYLCEYDDSVPKMHEKMGLKP